LTSNRRILAGAIALAVVVAACGGSGSKTAAPTGNGGNGGATSQPSDGGGGNGGGNGNGTGGGNGNGTGGGGGNGGSTSQPTDAPSGPVPGSAGDLEKLIPDKVGANPIEKMSFDYSTFPWASFGGSGDSTGIDKLLTDNGKSLSDIAFALGTGTSTETTGLPTIIYALQVKGLDASKFVVGFDSSYPNSPEITVGGKKVHGSISSGFGSVTYLHNDIVFMVTASEKDLNEVLAFLP
jgi:hypothetical protein